MAKINCFWWRHEKTLQSNIWKYVFLKIQDIGIHNIHTFYVISPRSYCDFCRLSGQLRPKIGDNPLQKEKRQVKKLLNFWLSLKITQFDSITPLPPSPMLCEVHYICLGSATLPKDWTVNIVLGGEGGIKKKVHDKIWLSLLFCKGLSRFFTRQARKQGQKIYCVTLLFIPYWLLMKALWLVLPWTAIKSSFWWRQWWRHSMTSSNVWNWEENWP